VQSVASEITADARHSAPHFAGLCINEDGELVDEKTGKVINEFGATRFDVAVRALRGDFDPPEGSGNTERTSGVLLDSLLSWPAVYTFNIVLRTHGLPPQQLVDEMRDLVNRTCSTTVAADECAVTERMGGKYLSLQIPALIRAPEFIQMVFTSLEGDTRVIMKY
jgi:putative lipoic acid-binding regulatory protein